MSSPPSSTPLHDAARANRPHLEQSLKNAGALYSKMIEHIRSKGRFSVNFKPSTLKGLLEGGQCLNVFEVCDAQAAGSKREPEEVLRERLGKFYERRVVFEKKAGVSGANFHYGALNIGGMGAPRYGRLCVVFERCGTVADEPLWMSCDSLKGRWFSGPPWKLDWSVAQMECSDNEMAPVLAAKKCVSQGVTLADVGDRLCNDSDYVEGLRVRRPEPRKAAEIRSETDAEVQRRALEAVLRGTDASEELDLAVHSRVRSLADSLGIPWREVTT